MKVTALALMLIVAPTDVMAGPFCKGSPMQFCRMMCPQPNCARGQCAMRQGRCCDMKCQPIEGLKGGRPGGLVGGSDGSEEVNCCGGGSACGYVHCPAIAPDKKGCVRPWMLPKKSDGTKMTMDDCKVGAKKAASSACMDNESAADKLCKGSCSDLKNSCGKTLGCGPHRVNVAKLCPKTCGMCSKDKGEYNDGQENDGPSRHSGGFQVDPGFGRVTQRAQRARMCPNSPRQMCKMLCRPRVCPQGQCAMRQGSCCDMKCVGGH